MAAAPATASAGHVVISVVPTVQGDATGSEVQQSESISANMVMTKLTMLNRIVFCVALLEWAGNAVGTLAFLWATVVLLGGFSSLLSRMDFWFAMVMIFVEGSRVFIRNDASVNQWLFGSTSAFRWENLSSPRVLAQSKVGRLIAMITGISLKISFYMLFAVIAAVLVANLQIPVAFLQILLSIMRLRILLGNHHHDYRPLPPGASPNLVPSIVIFFMMELCQGSSYILAAIFGLISLFRRKSLVRDLKFEQEWGEEAVNLYCRQAYQARKEKGLLPSDNSTPSLTSLAIKPLDSTSSKTQIAGLRVLYNFLERLDPESKKELITDITDVCKKTVAVPNLVDMLGSTVPLDKDIIRLLAASVIAELTGRIKISEFPGMVKLISLVLDYKNRQNSMRPTDSLKISEFPRVEEMMYSLYILSAKNRQNSLPKCVPGNNEGNPNSIRHMIRTADESTLLQRMLFPLLGMSILQRLACDPDNCDEIVEDATYISTKTIGLISYVTNEEISGDPQKALVLRSSLNFVRWLAIDRGKIGSRFRQELSDNPLLLNSLGRILDGDYQPELWEPVVDIIAALALDEAARQDIGSTQSIIPKLMCTFLRQDDVNPIENNDHSLQRAAGEALANLTIKSTENCWAILLAEQGHNLIKKLIDMLDDENCICVAANLLHNLCANSRDKLTDIDLGASAQLEYALPKASLSDTTFKVLTEDTDAAALVEKLLDTLNSNREPCPEYPRIRRVLVETTRDGDLGSSNLQVGVELWIDAVRVAPAAVVPVVVHRRSCSLGLLLALPCLLDAGPASWCPGGVGSAKCAHDAYSTPGGAAARMAHQQRRPAGMGEEGTVRLGGSDSEWIVRGLAGPASVDVALLGLLLRMGYGPAYSSPTRPNEATPRHRRPQPRRSSPCLSSTSTHTCLHGSIRLHVQHAGSGQLEVLPGTHTGMEPQTMATTPATASDGGDVVLAVDGLTEHTNGAGGEARLRNDISEHEQRESSANANLVKRKLKTLNNIVFCVALLEWAGNAVGTLAFLWATVILLGGFSSLLSRTDFWIATVMIFVEGSRGNMMVINLRANGHLQSVLLPTVMQMVRTTEGKQLEAALCVASQIGYVIPEYFVQMLESDTNAAAAELVEKLVNTLKSIREPSPDYPRIRRLLVELVTSIVEKCPRYKEIFLQKGMNDALDMVKGTPSRLEKYRVFLGDEGVVAENLPMRDLIDKARRLINLETPTPDAQPVQP
nr:unnamed protein product [Digitaria exilis]